MEKLKLLTKTKNSKENLNVDLATKQYQISLSWSTKMIET